MTEIVIGIVGLLLVAASLFHTARINRQATDTQMFLEFTARFNALTDFREQLVHDNLKLPYRQSPALDSAIGSYFDLLSQEFHLNRQRILRDRIWKLWQPDIRQIVDTPMMRQAWIQTMKQNYAHYRDFCAYIESLMTPPANEPGA